MQLDALLFGGGAAGLWLLDELSRRGHAAVLLEAGELGQGQTVASQGIIHGGLKYTLGGLLTPSAVSVREMPAIWRDCLAGRRSPHLKQTRIRSEWCSLWQTGSISSRLGMLGAKFGLSVVPESLTIDHRPSVLSKCPGTVARIDEQVISPVSFLSELAQRRRDRIVRIDARGGLDFVTEAPARVTAVRITNSETGRKLEFQPRHVVFTAGAGNAELLRRVGLASPLMQRRPLQMLMLRGDLPTLNGHCVDGAKTRVTITTDTDSAGRTVWQVGGQIAEDGVRMDELALISHGVSELQSVIPGLDLSSAEAATHRIDRAERSTPAGKRPETTQVISQGNVLTAWPTKLALVPRLAEELVTLVGRPSVSTRFNTHQLEKWPRPTVALPPWERSQNWHRLDNTPQDARRVA